MKFTEEEIMQLVKIFNRVNGTNVLTYTDQDIKSAMRSVVTLRGAVVEKLDEISGIISKTYDIDTNTMKVTRRQASTLTDVIAVSSAVVREAKALKNILEK